MSDSVRSPEDRTTTPAEPVFDQLLDRLDRLEAQVDDPDTRAEVHKMTKVIRQFPGTTLVSKRIEKYTTRDIAEAFVGGILLSLPLLVEDGVFEIAEWFLATTVGGIPVFLVGNILFIFLLTIGIIYWTDIREVRVTKPILGIVPRRLVGVLSISFITAAFLLILWGRHQADNPGSALEVFARVTVIWAAATFGASLGDILPGESKGQDLTLDNLTELIESE